MESGLFIRSIGRSPQGVRRNATDPDSNEREGTESGHVEPTEPVEVDHMG